MKKPIAILIIAIILVAIGIGISFIKTPETAKTPAQTAKEQEIIREDLAAPVAEMKEEEIERIREDLKSKPNQPTLTEEEREKIRAQLRGE